MGIDRVFQGRDPHYASRCVASALGTNPSYHDGFSIEKRAVRGQQFIAVPDDQNGSGTFPQLVEELADRVQSVKGQGLVLWFPDNCNHAIYNIETVDSCTARKMTGMQMVFAKGG